jgi:16S rRNA (cytidine1402-2'-O)-methyltransferase
MTGSPTDRGGPLPGKLYVVATPIGNMADMSPRAAQTLGQVAAIAAEDTRRTGRLLLHFGIKTRLFSCHEHNESAVIDDLLSELAAGRDVALVSDAGTPLISDPGWRLVAAARHLGVEVLVIPGPSAVVAALSVSGLPTDRFVFEGFLPRRSSARRERLKVIAADERTIVCFEAVHRIERTLKEMVDVFGAKRPAAIARELTKLHETTTSGTLGDLADRLGGEIPLKGEFVIVVAGAPASASADEQEIQRVYGLLSGALKPDAALALCAEITGASRNRIYALTRR